jgi:hypothetical protein
MVESHFVISLQDNESVVIANCYLEARLFIFPVSYNYGLSFRHYVPMQSSPQRFT